MRRILKGNLTVEVWQFIVFPRVWELLEWASRKGKDWEVVTVTNLNHVTIWVMEKQLINLDTSFFNHCCDIFNSHLFQLPHNQAHVCALKGYVVVFGIYEVFLLGHVFWFVALQQVNPNPIAKQPGQASTMQ